MSDDSERETRVGLPVDNQQYCIECHKAIEVNDVCPECGRLDKYNNSHYAIGFEEGWEKDHPDLRVNLVRSWESLGRPAPLRMPEPKIHGRKRDYYAKKASKRGLKIGGSSLERIQQLDVEAHDLWQQVVDGNTSINLAWEQYRARIGNPVPPRITIAINLRRFFGDVAAKAGKSPSAIVNQILRDWIDDAINKED